MVDARMGIVSSLHSPERLYTNLEWQQSWQIPSIHILTPSSKQGPTGAEITRALFQPGTCHLLEDFTTLLTSLPSRNNNISSCESESPWPDLVLKTPTVTGSTTGQASGVYIGLSADPDTRIASQLFKMKLWNSTGVEQSSR
ncbi:hypothetical protein EYF80_027306 [Liparis tanakae]|uniref:Uncharacterized protein n=1 Tax=Liparis tanakae TaxID=230148 RepID=A0A4Z2HBW8_9TELE|nr:hypothetical protein EYF80_027306 [Liparis tanakae]